MAGSLVLLLSLLWPDPLLDLGTSEHALNGEPTSGDEFAFVVDVTANGQDCTGTLLSETLVLTAAHCVVGTPSLDDVSVKVTRDGSVATFRAAEVGVHPQFCGAPHCDGEVFDFGYIRLANSQRLEAYPRLLRSRDEAASTLRVGAPLVVVGFGLTSDAAIFSGNMRRVASVDVRAVTSRRTAFSTDGSNHDTCFGDSGGPALAVGRDSEWVLAGVLSAGFGQGCGQGALYGTTVNLEPWLSDVDYVRNADPTDIAPARPATCNVAPAPRGYVPLFEPWTVVIWFAVLTLGRRRAGRASKFTLVRDSTPALFRVDRAQRRDSRERGFNPELRPQHNSN